MAGINVLENFFERMIALERQRWTEEQDDDYEEAEPIPSHWGRTVELPYARLVGNDLKEDENG